MAPLDINTNISKSQAQRKASTAAQDNKSEKATVKLQTPYMQKLRAGIVEEVIFRVGFILKQQLKTIHLAVKLFDIVSL